MSPLNRVRAAAMCAFALTVLGLSCSESKKGAAQPSRVVIVTPTESISPEEFRGAEALALAYSSKDAKGEIVHVVLPSGAKGALPSESAVASFIAETATDSGVKAIVVDPALPGSAVGLRRAKQAKPGLLGFAGGSREALAMEASADLVVDLDRVYRAYLIPWEAKKMGAKALVAAYSLEDAAEPALAREKAIMASASADLGLRYAAMAAPPGADAGTFARAMTGSWLRDYGPDAALYCSDAELAAPLIAGAIAGDGIVVDVAGQATRAAYAAALGLDLGPAKGDARKERRLVERALAAIGGRGRFGEWESGYGRASIEGLGEFAMRVASGAARADDLKGLVAALDARSSGASWLAAYDVDPATGVRSGNRVLLRQDVYVLGSGYLQSALQAVPQKYLVLSPAAP